MSIPKLKFTKAFTGPYKIDLPESVLASIVNKYSSPLVFRLETPGAGPIYAGVREFSAEEGSVALSEQIASDLKVELSADVSIAPIELPKGTSLTLKPSAPATIDYKSLLEAWLPKNYTALAKGMVLHIEYLDTTFNFEVVDVQPNEAVCIIDCDINLEIEDPEGGAIVEESKPVTLEFDTTVMIPGDELVLLSADIPESVTSIKVKTGSKTHPVLVGPEHATSQHSYLVAADDEYVTVPVSLIGPRISVLAHQSVTISTENEPKTADTNSNSAEATANESVCPHCGKNIPQQSFMLHTSFCARNSVRCAQCGRVFTGEREVPKSHTMLHDLEAVGEEHQCTKCNSFSSKSQSELAHHRATTCSGRLHICRFCHLLVPQGEASRVDIFEGITGHESYCSTRTADCPICNKPVRLRNLEMHLNGHKALKRERKPPVMCANHNCPNVFTEKTPQRLPFGLCAQCFGPLAVPGNNTDLSKVAQRIERHLMLQMIRGCGKTWCQNKYCPFGTGGTQKWTAKEAMRTAKELVASSDFHFCVDEISARKQMFVDIGDGYDLGWRGLAISQCSTEQEATQWLEKNAVRVNE